jgi:hypothetical protein
MNIHTTVQNKDEGDERKIVPSAGLYIISFLFGIGYLARSFSEEAFPPSSWFLYG